MLQDEEKRLLEKQGSLKELLEAANEDDTFAVVNYEEQLRKLWEQLENNKISKIEYQTKAQDLVDTGK